MMLQRLKKEYAAILELNLAILFISTSGVLGKYIELPVPIVICLRALIAGVVLWVYGKIRGFSFKVERRDRITVLIGGIFLGAHWILYFYSLKVSNVAIALLSLYTFPTITALLEPIILQNKLHKIHLLLGGIVLLGIYFLVPDFSIGNDSLLGAGLGVLSAIFYSLRNILLKPKISQYNQTVLMCNQLVIIAVLLLPTLGVLDGEALMEYLPSTILLAIFTTAIGHTLFVYSLSHFSTTSASLMSSLQPIYGIILAYIFLNETLNIRTAIGGVLIISTVVIESVRLSRKP